MRNMQKQEVLGLIDSLHQAHEEIKGALAQNNLSLAQNMLAECQEFAISLGESIETLEGEGHATVSCVEEYCEALFHIHEELTDGQLSENKIYKRLRKQLVKVENSAKNDIRVRKEVVFFPYKASMWDSLESVWKAADEDPNCDAYVVPIPYYDKRPDGSLGKMHYEGDEYPKYVPITSYKMYDFEKRKPDEIYIHNPYDNLNLVTSVPTRFFSDNLKKHTDKLVYIPYFILSEIKPDEDEKIEGMKHFCTTPGVFNADKVVVQSEDMKQVYIKVLLNATENHSEAARKYWDNKILGTGSPKIDKVLNTKKEDLEVPQEWLRVIEKPDGSWKKIVFYNTSVGALLQHNEKMLQKMASVFEIFKENQDEVVLLWRPHPLIKATVESMRPQLWIEYDRLVKKYQEEGWGIYDDSSDIDRAIVLSDAYYGDGSSVVCLYEKTQKNIFIQKVFNRGYTLCDCSICDTEVFGVDEEGRHFYCIDRKNGKVKWVEGYPKLFYESYSYNGVVENGRDIVFIPYQCNSFAIYNKDNLKIKKIEIPSDNNNYITHIYTKSSILLFPNKGEKVIELNCNTYKINYYSLPDELMANGDVHFSKDTVLYKDDVFCVIERTNLLVSFNIITKKTNVYELEGEFHFTCICGERGMFYLATTNGNIAMWNSDTKKVEEIYSENSIEKTHYWKSIYVKETNEIWFFPFETNKILILDEKGKKVCDIMLEDIVQGEKKRPYIWMAKKSEDEIWISMREVDEIICINLYSKHVTKYNGARL